MCRSHCLQGVEGIKGHAWPNRCYHWSGWWAWKSCCKSCSVPGDQVMINLHRFQCQYAKAMGLEVLAIDTSKEKHDLCMNELGAASFIDFATTKDIVADVKTKTGGLGPHAVIVVAG